MDALKDGPPEQINLETQSNPVHQKRRDAAVRSNLARLNYSFEAERKRASDSVTR
jgi:hypothetical protein